MDKKGKTLNNTYICVLFLLLTFLHGDIGHNNVVYEGKAGEIPIRVFVKLPGVVPGLADVSIKVFSDDIHKVTIQPNKKDKDRKSKSPPPDIAEPIKGEKNLFSTQLWLMDYGSYSLDIRLYQGQIVHRASIPVNSTSSRILEMNRGTSILLSALLALLFFGAINIIRIAYKDSTQPPGDHPDRGKITKSYIVTVLSLIILSTIIFGGKNWWDKIDTAYQNNIFQTLENKIEILDNGKEKFMSIEIVDELWKQNRMSDIIPDHGKIMHIYLISDDYESIAHLHPSRTENTDIFIVKMPPVNFGKYYLFMDVTHETGFSHTMTNKIIYNGENVDFRNSIENIERDIDDSWILNSNENRITWKDKKYSYKSGDNIDLDFQVMRDGQPAVLEPYISMGGHAALLKKDQTVFVHIHPIGTISMASQEMFQENYIQSIVDQEDICFFGFINDSTDNYFNNTSPNGEVSFPAINLENTGEYGLWVQVKSAGEVITQKFDFEITL